MTIDALLAQLDRVGHHGAGRYIAKCPSHTDKSPSLSVSEGERGLLLKCWAGCTLDEITAALGTEIKDLFFDAPIPHGQRPTPKPVPVDRGALAFRFEMAALDRRLRAEHVRQAANAISINNLPDPDLDRLVDAVACGYADIERAELLEGVADGLRAKAFARKERTVRHAV